MLSFPTREIFYIPSFAKVCALKVFLNIAVRCLLVGVESTTFFQSWSSCITNYDISVFAAVDVHDAKN